MGTRSALLALTALVGCSKDDDSASDLFLVVGTTPEDGAEDATPASQPEIRVNAPAEPANCTSESLDFVALNSDGTVAFQIDYNIVIESEGYRIRFLHEAALPEGYLYGLAVETVGETPCADINGRPLEAFGAEFAVP